VLAELDRLLAAGRRSLSCNPSMVART